MAVPSGRSPRVVLTATQLVLARVGFVFFLILFGLGLAGMSVLMDESGGSALSKTRAAAMYKKMVSVNPLFAGLFVNGGLLGMLFCYIKVKDHFDLKKEEAEAPPAVEGEVAAGAPSGQVEPPARPTEEKKDQ